MIEDFHLKILRRKGWQLTVALTAGQGSGCQADQEKFAVHARVRWTPLWCRYLATEGDKRSEIERKETGISFLAISKRSMILHIEKHKHSIGTVWVGDRLLKMSDGSNETDRKTERQR